MIQIVDLSAFVTVVKVASFTEAARRLDTTKSVVSRRISDLERELGAPLLDRSIRGVRPTEAGAVYYAKCVRILESIDSANDFVSSFNSQVKGRLRLLLPDEFTELLVPLLNRFADAYPDVVLDVEIGNDEILRDGNFDMAFRCSVIEDSELIARQIRGFGYVLCASPGYIAARGKPEAVSDLEGHDALIHSAGELGIPWQLDVEGRAHEPRLHERLRSRSYGQLMSAACSGLGIILAPDLIVADALSDGRLCEVLPECRPPFGALSVLYPKNRRASQKIQKLLRFVMDEIGEAALPAGHHL